jgi:hypothetical protein
MTNTIKIEELVDWSDPKRVQTKHGPRDLRKAPASPEFWQVWKTAKTSLKEAGVSCGKNGSGWEVLWWQPISEEEQQQKKAAKVASRASSADIDIPAPHGLEYLPYQKAGIAYCLSVFGDI